MGFRVIEQGNISGVNAERDLYAARVAVSNYYFTIYWNSDGFEKIINEEINEGYAFYNSDPGHKKGLKFSDIIERVMYSKSKETLKEYLKTGMDSIIYEAKRIDVSKVTGRIYDNDTNQEIEFYGISSIYRLSVYKDSYCIAADEQRKKLLAGLASEKKNVLWSMGGTE